MHESKSKKSSRWSEPKWHERFQQWYEERTDRHGKLEYNWIGPTLPDQSVPRSTAPTVDDITQTVQNMNISENTYDVNQYQYPIQSDMQAEDPTSPPAYTHAASDKHRSRKGKGKAVQPEETPVYGNQMPVDSSGSSATYRANPGVDMRQVYGQDDYNSPIGANDTYFTEEGYSEQELQEAMYQSHRDHYRSDWAGESSSSAQAGYSGQYYVPADGSSNAYETYADEMPTPRGMSPVPQYEDAGKVGLNEELLDDRFVVEPSYKFQFGAVFKTLWSEPQGSSKAISDRVTEAGEVNTSQGLFFTGLRRFIVVATDEGHSTCVPILTYGHRGCKKPGVRASKHGIIYEPKKKQGAPKPLKGEHELGFKPVALKMSVEGERLAPESRVNYSKLVTIEHNVRVLFIGSVYDKYHGEVEDAVNECWGRKKTHRTKKPKK